MAHSTSLLTLIAVLAFAPAFAVTPESSPAVLSAMRSGEIIGAAVACGVPEEQLGPLRRKAAQAFRAKATSDADLDRAHLLYDQALAHGAEEVRSRRAQCSEAARALADFEKS